MIKRATEQDIPRLIEMGAEFYAMTAFAEEGLLYDPASVKKTFEVLLKGPDSVIFLTEEDGEITGGVGAVVSSLFFNFGIRTAHEFFWYVDPSHRGKRTALRLYLALVEWVHEKNVTVLQMAALRSSPQSVRDYYVQGGFRESETAFIKRLT